MFKCVICNKESDGWKNNPEPLSDGVCCAKCNDEQVLPMRLFLAGVIKDQLLVLETGKTAFHFEKVKSGEEFLPQLQKAVEGYIELFPKSDTKFVFLVNEEGLIYGLEKNLLAKRIFDIDAVGNIVVCPKEYFVKCLIG